MAGRGRVSYSAAAAGRGRAPGRRVAAAPVQGFARSDGPARVAAGPGGPRARRARREGRRGGRRRRRPAGRSVGVGAPEAAADGARARRSPSGYDSRGQAPVVRRQLSEQVFRRRASVLRRGSAAARIRPDAGTHRADGPLCRGTRAAQTRMPRASNGQRARSRTPGSR